MKAKLLYRAVVGGLLATLLLLGCGSPLPAQFVTPVHSDMEETLTPESTLALTPTVQASSTPEPMPISYPFKLGTPLPPVTEKISPENAAEIIELAKWDIKSVRKFTFAPDGQSLLMGTTSGELLGVRVSDGGVI